MMDWERTLRQAGSANALRGTVSEAVPERVLDDLFPLVVRDLRDTGLSVPKQYNGHIVLSNALHTFGQCRQKRGSEPQIYISRITLRDYDVLIDTMMHEFIHLVLGAKHGHDAAFKKYMNAANALGYHVSVYVSPEEGSQVGLNDALQARANYMLICNTCGKTTYYQKKGPVLTHPERYRCRSCKGNDWTVKVKKRS